MKKFFKVIGIIFGVFMLIGILGAIFTDDAPSTPAKRSSVKSSTG